MGDRLAQKISPDESDKKQALWTKIVKFSTIFWHLQSKVFLS